MPVVGGHPATTTAASRRRRWRRERWPAHHQTFDGDGGRSEGVNVIRFTGSPPPGCGSDFGGPQTSKRAGSLARIEEGGYVVARRAHFGGAGRLRGAVVANPVVAGVGIRAPFPLGAFALRLNSPFERISTSRGRGEEARKFRPRPNSRRQGPDPWLLHPCLTPLSSLFGDAGVPAAASVTSSSGLGLSWAASTSPDRPCEPSSTLHRESPRPAAVPR